MRIIAPQCIGCKTITSKCKCSSNNSKGEGGATTYLELGIKEMAKYKYYNIYNDSG